VHIESCFGIEQLLYMKVFDVHYGIVVCGFRGW
jgi:hypothetical protein